MTTAPLSPQLAQQEAAAVHDASPAAASTPIAGTILLDRLHTAGFTAARPESEPACDYITIPIGDSHEITISGAHSGGDCTIDYPPAAHDYWSATLTDTAWGQVDIVYLPPTGQPFDADTAALVAAITARITSLQ